MTSSLRMLLITMALLAWFVPSAHARSYDPSKGRWIERDPMGRQGSLGTTSHRVSRIKDQYSDGLSLYQYVRSAPLQLTDPFGLESKAPEYQPDLPMPLPSGSPIVIPLRSIKPGDLPCGSLRPSNLRDCRATVTFHGFCPVEELAYKVLTKGDVCAYLANYLKQLGGRSISFECPKGKQCCSKAQFAGTYPVTVQVTEAALSGTCRVTVQATGTIDVIGELGFCR